MVSTAGNLRVTLRKVYARHCYADSVTSSSSPLLLFRSLTCGFFLLMLLSVFPANGQGSNLPAGFSDQLVSGDWNEAVGLLFDNQGNRMFVWERGGRVWVVENNVKSLLIDISPEVGGWRDHGLLGFALHPNFENNGHFYLLYVVDRHHLMNFGTGSYNPAANEYTSATIGRLTRYTATRTANGYTVNAASRKILIGETRSTGIPVLSITHGVGSLLFGMDGTLLVSCGDGASPNGYDVGGAHTGSYAPQGLADGIITAREDVGSYRSQILQCISGKILRIDPETGNGIPSNPFYETANPQSVQSRVWALGLRNPFRMTLKPGTGSHNRNDANPGTLYLGDVGFVDWEEIDVVDQPGLNFGWPVFEGLETHPNYAALSPVNQYAPNPLFGQNGCTQQFFRFRDLIRQPLASGTPAYPNPCNSSVSIPAAYRWVHARPVIDWKHTDSGPSRVGIFNGNTASVINIGAPGSPTSGPQFGGSASVGGVWYTGTHFPAAYQNTYFHADYGARWIRNVSFTNDHRPTSVRNFTNGATNSSVVVVAMAAHPVSGELFYLNFPSQLRKISYIPSGNQPPVAVASVDKTFGTSPLTVQFTGSNSSDPNGQPITYRWNFGDNSTLSTQANPSHTFTAPAGVPVTYTVSLTVTDSEGASTTTTLIVSVNNTPPQVTITSPVNNSTYPITQETIYTLSANVTDAQHSASQLSYRWQTFLHHNDHFHPEPFDTNPVTTTKIDPYGCDGETYYYRIVLTVTDAGGLATTREVFLYPDCGGAANVTNFTASAGNAAATLSWTSPPGSFDEILIVGRAGSSITASPSGDGSTYQANLNFSGNGTAFGGGKVLYKGKVSPQTVTNLTNGTTYYFKAFTRTGNAWSAGIEVNATPANPVAGLSFYRAINLNGPALNIDNQPWEASASAANFSFTGRTFTDPNVALIPPTDVNRTNMIRSSMYHSLATPATITLSSMPAGSYDVYLYNWEDNGAATFSLSLQNQVVLSNFNSGPAGSWRRLGPYRVQVSAGTILVSCSGGAANLSGIEVWAVNAPANQLPTVVITSPANNATFSAPATINITATASDSDGSIARVEFFQGSTKLGETTSSPYSFSWSNVAAGTYQLTARATDNQGAVGSSAVVGVVVQPSSDNCTASGSILRELWTGIGGFQVSQIPLATAPASVSYPTALQGPTNAGDSYGARYRGYLCVPVTGSYTFYIACDDNGELYLSSDDSPVNKVKIAEVSGQNAFTGVNVWTKYESQKSVAITLQANRRYYIEALHKENGGGDNFSVGWQTPANSTISVIPGSVLSPVTTGGQTNQPPVVALTAPANNATFTAPATINLTATASDSDGSIARVEFFQGSTKLGETTSSPYSFSWTNVAAGSYQLTARATDNQGAVTTSALVNVTVQNPAPGLVLYRAINLNGPAMSIDNQTWEASATAANFTFAAGSFANQNVPLIPATDANRATMIRSSIWGSAVFLNVLQTPNGSYDVYLYNWEDNNPATFSLNIENQPVLSNFNSGAAGSWRRLGPYRTQISDGQLNITTSGGHANLSGLEIWSVNPGGRMGGAALAERSAAPATIRVYPNPNDGERMRVVIEGTEGEKPHQIRMYDATGRTTIHSLTAYSDETGRLEALLTPQTRLRSGLYLIQVVSDKTIQYVKVTIH
jgi:glucose/arabinose dehydrogenase